MADVSSHDPEELLENVIIDGIEPQIVQILKESSCKPKLEIREDLITTIDYDVLQKCRNTLFNHAVGMYNDLLASSGLQDKVRLDPITRRTSGTTAVDIIDLYMYVIGVVKHFPKGVLTNMSTYVDIDTVLKSHNVESVGVAIKDAIAAESSSSAIKVSSDKCSDCELEMGRLWTYIYNVEKVYNDKIVQLENRLGIKGLNSTVNSSGTQTHVQNNREVTQTALTVNAQQSQPGLQPQPGVHSQPGVQSPPGLNTPANTANNHSGTVTHGSPTISQLLEDTPAVTAGVSPTARSLAKWCR